MPFYKNRRTEDAHRSSAAFAPQCIYAAATVLLLASAAAPLHAQSTGPSGAQPDAALEEITVTARKRTETLVDVPTAITVFGEATLGVLKIDDFTDYATKVPNLSFAYGSNLSFTTSREINIRGVAGTNTTGMYIDDTPVDASIDPRLVDVERIEILKGPQGTLYGAGSMGGNVRIVTQKPDLTKDSGNVTMEGGHTDDAATPDYQGKAIANFIMIPDTAAVRVLAFYDHEGGFLTRTYPNSVNPSVRDSVDDQGATRIYGSSVSALVKFVDALSITPRFLFQDTRILGFPAPYAPLPSFEVDSFTLNRDQNLQEVARDQWNLPSLEVNYAGHGWDVVSSTSYYTRNTLSAEDSTEATKQILELYGYTPVAGPIRWQGVSKSNQLTEEDRISYDDFAHTNGVLGVYYQHTVSSGGIPATYADGLAAQGLYPTDLLFNYMAHPTLKDFALFGEDYVHFTDRLTLTVGARYYTHSETGYSVTSGFFEGDTTVDVAPLPAEHDHGISPKAGLDFKITPDVMVYTSAARGFRPGGSGQVLPSACDASLSAIGYTAGEARTYKPDTLWTYEVGAKAKTPDNLTMTFAAFQTNWSGIQQSIYLAACGFPFTANSGAARIRGTELEIDGRVAEGLDLRFGAGYQDAIITNAGDAPRPVGSRILQVPPYNASLAMIYHRQLTESMSGTVSADYSETGNSLSDNSGTTTPLVRKAYGVGNIRAAVDRFNSTYAFYMKNLFNSRANLGDIQYEGFEQSTAAGLPYPRVVVLRPLQFGVSYSYKW